MKMCNCTLCAFLLIALLFGACQDGNDNEVNIPSSQEFQDLRQTALDNITQNFQFDSQTTDRNTFTSNQGVQIDINSCNSASGSQAAGTVDLEFVEIFDRGTMLVTNKPTMGILPNGEQSILISGGELFFNATENGIQLGSCNMSASIPGDLTGGVNNDMTFWAGEIDTIGDLTWVAADRFEFGGDSSEYFVFFNDFGWINCDVFYDDLRPKTDITVNVPEGYNNQNSAVYFSIVGETSALGTLNGQFPIGLECHIIFVTAEGTDWRYDIQSITVSENEELTFKLEDTAVSSESEMIAIINNLP